MFPTHDFLIQRDTYSSMQGDGEMLSAGRQM